MAITNTSPTIFQAGGRGGLTTQGLSMMAVAWTVLRTRKDMPNPSGYGRRVLPGQWDHIVVAVVLSLCWRASLCNGKASAHASIMRRCIALSRQFAFAISANMAEPESEPLVRKTIYLDASLAREVDDYRFATRARTETEAYRALIRAGLDAMKELASKQA